MKSSIRNKELMDKLQELYNDGNKLTMTEIADALNLNRNQVAGLLSHGRRMGYDLPRRQIRHGRPEGMPLSEFKKLKMKENQIKASKVKEAQFKAVGRPKRGPINSDFRALYIQPEILVIPPEGLPLLQVPTDGCKFPIGQTGQTHLFCSQPKIESHYCLKHLKVMWPNRYAKV